MNLKNPSRYVWFGSVTDSSFKLNLDVYEDDHYLYVATDNLFGSIISCIKNAERPTEYIDAEVFGRIDMKHASHAISRCLSVVGAP